MNDHYAFGLDIGNKTSRLAIIDLSTFKYQVVRNGLAEIETDTILLYNQDKNERVFGYAANQMLVRNKKNAYCNLMLNLEEDIDKVNKNNIFTTGNRIDNTFEFQFMPDMKLESCQLLGSFINNLVKVSKESYNALNNTNINKDEVYPVSIVVPESFIGNEKALKSVFYACSIAKLSPVKIVTRSESSMICWLTKHNIKQPLPADLVLFVDIGSLYCSIGLFKVSINEETKLKEAELLNSLYDDDIVNGNRIDYLIYEQLKQVCLDKHKITIKDDSKGAFRLMKTAQKIKMSLSAVNETDQMCENLGEGQDIKFHFTREELERICLPIKEKLETLIKTITSEHENFIVEVVSGTTRIPFIQEVIKTETKKDLKFTLDPMVTRCFGAAQAVALDYQNKANALRQPAVDNVARLLTFSINNDSKKEQEDNTEQENQQEQENLAKYAEAELKLQNSDESAVKAYGAKNEFESFIFETNSIISDPKNAELISNADEIKTKLQELEDYMNYDDIGSTIKGDECFKVYTEKLTAIKTEFQGYLGNYYTKIKEQQEKKDLEIENIAKTNPKEENNAKDDHDFRKLDFDTRMRKVMLNKDEGTSLFKDGTLEPALGRYKKALTHCDKFVDLVAPKENNKTADDEGEIDEEKQDEEIEDPIYKERQLEVKNVKIALNSNIALILFKLKKYKESLEFCNSGLEIDPLNYKLLFRRASVYYETKKFKEAIKDLKTNMKNCEETNATEKELKPLTKLNDKINKQIQKQKLQQQKMAKRMFS